MPSLLATVAVFSIIVIEALLLVSLFSSRLAAAAEADPESFTLLLKSSLCRSNLNLRRQYHNVHPISVTMNITVGMRISVSRMFNRMLLSTLLFITWFEFESPTRWLLRTLKISFFNYFFSSGFKSSSFDNYYSLLFYLCKRRVLALIQGSLSTAVQLISELLVLRSLSKLFSHNRL